MGFVLWIIKFLRNYSFFGIENRFLAKQNHKIIIQHHRQIAANPAKLEKEYLKKKTASKLKAPQKLPANRANCVTAHSAEITKLSGQSLRHCAMRLALKRSPPSPDAWHIR